MSAFAWLLEPAPTYVLLSVGAMLYLAIKSRPRS